MAQIHNLTPDGSSWLLYVPKWLPSTPEKMDNINAEKPTHQHVIKIFGKEMLSPRYTQSYGADYKYSGSVAKGKPWIPLLLEIREKLVKDLAHMQVMPLNFNMCLVNWYDTGDHNIGRHSDDERQLVKNSPIAGLSWGSTRTFKLAPKKGVNGYKLDLPVNDGDLIVMGGTLQKTHTHEIPKTKSPVGPRVSFTFRIFEGLPEPFTQQHIVKKETKSSMNMEDIGRDVIAKLVQRPHDVFYFIFKKNEDPLEPHRPIAVKRAEIKKSFDTTVWPGYTADEYQPLRLKWLKEAARIIKDK